MPELLFEIGTEELPPNLIGKLTNQIKENIIKGLSESNIEVKSENSKTFNTPRRIAIHITNLPEKQEVKTEEVKGPDRNKAFDKDRNPTQAAIGFAKKHNLESKDLILKKVNNAEYVFAKVTTGGKTTKELLTNTLPNSIKQTTGDKFMSWGNYDEKFARPIRWILAILGNETIPFKYAGIESSNQSYGHRFLANKKITVSSPKEYKDILRKNCVLADQEERKKYILDELLNKKCKETNASLSENPLSLLETVTNITEYPSLLLCSFDKEFLELPAKVIETVLEHHQKCFALYDIKKEKLLPNFITITNGTENNNEKIKEEIKKGNEKVVKARLRDAQFFFSEDLKHPFTFEERGKGLGSMQEKVERITKLSEYIFHKIEKTLKPNITKEDLITCAKLCKLDLSTRMVFEFTELQGEIGSIYAKVNKYNESISEGIKEHYYPRFLGDQIPKTLSGLVLGIADKLDNIICLFAIGKIPSGSADPFALRRQAQGIMENTNHWKLKININEMIDYFIKNIISPNLKEKITKEKEEQIKDFLTQRFKSLMETLGYEHDIISSVISASNPLSDIISAKEKIDTLKNTFISNQKEKYKPFLMAAKRLVRIVEKDVNGNIDTSHLKTEEEKYLLKRFEEFSNKLTSNKYEKTKDFLDELSSLTEPINKFFDKVLVNDPDPKIKQTRQALLKKGKDLFEKICDFNQILERN